MKLKPFTKDDWFCFSGAHCFKLPNGVISQPLIGYLSLADNINQAVVIVSGVGSVEIGFPDNLDGVILQANGATALFVLCNVLELEVLPSDWNTYLSGLGMDRIN